MEQRNIIHASEEDAGELLALYKAQLGRPFCFWDEDYPGRETIEYDLSRNALFVLKENGRILASISIDQDENVERLDCWHKELAPGGELSRLAVLPEMQNRGLARIMLGFGMEELKRRGCRSVHFLVSKGNIKAIRSYAVFGIKVVGERYLYGQDYLCYEKDLQDQVSK